MFKVNQFEPKTLTWWYSQRSKIDLSPIYQRQGRLWSQTDKAYLVDSILNEYDIPKIYLADFTFGHSTSLNKKGMHYAIIDGKQRLEALFDFFSGDLTLEPEFVYQHNKSLRLGGLGYSDIKRNYPEIADIFDNYSLSIMRVITDDLEKINELFIRLNRSKPLTGAEIRNAMSGPVPDIVRALIAHEFLKTCIAFPIKRAQNSNAATKLLLFEYNGQPAETKRVNLDKFTRKTKTEDRDKVELASRRVFDVLNRMSGIFLPKDPLLKSSGMLPVLYWFIRNASPTSDQHIREF